MGVLKRKGRTENVSDPAKLLIMDHEKVERIFTEIEEADSPNVRQGLVSQLFAELTRHTTIEEEVLYPYVRQNLDDGAALIDHAEEEHWEAKDLLEQVATLDPSSDQFMDTFKRLKTAVSQHVKEEEGELFPKMDDAFDNAALARLRGQLEEARMVVTPTPSLPGDGGRASTASRSGTRSAGGGGRGNPVWVQPHRVEGGRWQVKREESTRASRVFDTQSEAESFARSVAEREKTELIVAGRDGTIRKKQSYGNDPSDVRG